MSTTLPSSDTGSRKLQHVAQSSLALGNPGGRVCLGRGGVQSHVEARSDVLCIAPTAGHVYLANPNGPRSSGLEPACTANPSRVVAADGAVGARECLLIVAADRTGRAVPTSGHNGHLFGQCETHHEAVPQRLWAPFAITKYGDHSLRTRAIWVWPGIRPSARVRSVS